MSVNQNLTRNFLNSISVFLVVYLCLRVFFVDVTHDEAYSYHNVKLFWLPEFLCSANTHWVNSFAIKSAIFFDFDKPWAIRWLSLFSGISLIVIVSFWINKIQNTYEKIAVFAVLLLNPYVLDYFILARGYATGIFFEVLSFVVLVKVVNDKDNQRYSSLILILSGMSVLSNFMFFYYFTAINLIYYYLFYLKPIGIVAAFKNKKIYFDLLISLGFVVLVLRAMYFILKCSNDFGFGGRQFIDSIFSEFLNGLFYGNIIGNYLAITPVAIGLCLIIFISVFYGLINFKKVEKIYGFSSLIVFLLFTLVLFNHFVLDVLYPTKRTALFFFPFISLNILFGFKYLIKHELINKLVLILFSGILIFNFAINISARKTHDFNAQIDSKAICDFLEKSNAKFVGLHWKHGGVFQNYYQLQEHSYSFEIETLFDDSIYCIEKFDYLVLMPPYDIPKTNNTTAVMIKEFEDTKSRIFRIDTLKSTKTNTVPQQ